MENLEGKKMKMIRLAYRYLDNAHKMFNEGNKYEAHYYFGRLFGVLNAYRIVTGDKLTIATKGDDDILDSNGNVVERPKENESHL